MNTSQLTSLVPIPALKAQRALPTFRWLMHLPVTLAPEANARLRRRCSETGLDEYAAAVAMALSVRIAAQKLAGARLHGLDIAVSLAGPIVTLMECDAPADVIERAFRLAAELPGDLLQDQWTAGKIARVLESDGRALVTLLLNRNTSSQRSAVSRQRGG